MSKGGSRLRRALTGLVATLLAVVLAGCQVTTSVGVRVQLDGTGAVTVAVDFDRAAVAAAGGLSGQLQLSDLEAAGWTVVSAPGAAGGTHVTLSHRFSRLSEVPVILGEIGRAPTGARTPLFTLALDQDRTTWTTTTTAVGAVDLTCGLACFGDEGLKRAYGSELGVSPAYLGGTGGMAAAAGALRFSFRLELPGRVQSSDVSPGHPGLQWAPALGTTTPVSASSLVYNVRHIVEASGAGTLTLVVLTVLIVVLAGAVRRLTRRRRAASA